GFMGEPNEIKLGRGEFHEHPDMIFFFYLQMDRRCYMVYFSPVYSWRLQTHRNNLVMPLTQFALNHQKPIIETKETLLMFYCNVKGASIPSYRSLQTGALHTLHPESLERSLGIAMEKR
ncbi:hypothetical protein ACJX0J_011385, partial [Zea mays]